MRYEIPWKEAVARMILEILGHKHKDNLSLRKFTSKELKDYYENFSDYFIGNDSIRQSVNKYLQNYRKSDPCVIEFLGKGLVPEDLRIATYKVTDDGIKILEVNAMTLEELQEVLETMEKEIEEKKKEIEEKKVIENEGD